MPTIEPQVEIRQIEPGDRLTGLSLGSEFTALKTFLQRHARSFHEQSLARTYAAFDVGGPRRIVGYLTLVCGEVLLDDRDGVIGGDVDYRYDHFPTVKIARLAVDQRFRGTGLGAGLVRLALGIAKGVVCPAVGCRFVIVDAKPQSVAFYEKMGFTLINTPANRALHEPVMFLDLHKRPA